MQGVVVGPPHPSEYSRLNFGQSSSSNEDRPSRPPKVLPTHEIPTHVKGKAQIKQVYMPKKKVDVLTIPIQEVDPPTSIIIGSANVPIIDINGQIVIKEPIAELIKAVPMGAVANDQEAKSSKRDSKYCQPKWCPLGLSKTKRWKLQRARHHKQMKEKMEKLRKDIFNSTHQSFPPLARETPQDIVMVTGTGQTGQAGFRTGQASFAVQTPSQTGQAGSKTGWAGSAASSTLQISQAGLEPAKPVPLPPMQADTSSGDSTPNFVAPIVATEFEDLQENHDEELVDYEPSLEHVDINVVQLSADGDFLGDDSSVAEFNFVT